MNNQLIEYLKEFISEARWERINEVLDERTEHITVVLEDIYQPHNASAVLRSCDGFGIQNVHVIENNNIFDASSEVTIGADQWLSLHRYKNPSSDNVADCFEALRGKGYQIVATTPHENDHNLDELDISKPTALVFGTELDGVTDQVMEQADAFVKIPMSGFSESFNISVSAAICLYDTSTRLRKSVAKSEWTLSENRREELLLEWVKKSIKAGDQLAEKWLSENIS
ncbi:MAG: RNA methyltransferase [Balneola sp.]|nr:RNA methyltransferase [Balneola sp.]MBO6650678.1 RNA methyltransferase [Balneola sp.]MBO6710590.1 RNA methyltransferase [Balneola sp.]MBO6799276.1 RNA methyltransferase [Balneola sp.]MBO6869595.1 RNA methyltransferase [Balneola sp.]